MTTPVILVEAQPRRVADAGIETVRLAGGGGDYAYGYGGQADWRAGIDGLPTIVTSLNFDGDDFGTSGVPQAAELVWKPSSQAAIDAVAGYFWTDAPIAVRIGDENAAGALPPVAIAGTVLEAPTEPGALRLRLADPAAGLKKPLLGAQATARFAGTGGLEGPVEWSALLKRRVWGRVWNLKGDPLDKANNVYSFADPLRPLLSIDAVRDRGAPAGSLVFLGWQGSAAATFAALQAAVTPQGGGVVCPSIACVKWWTQPSGDLTADLHGEIGGGYVETSAEIAAALVAEVGGPAFAAGAVAAAKAARPAPVGWVAKDDSTTVAAMLEELFGNVSLLWVLDVTGVIQIRAWSWGGASAAAAVSHQVIRKRVFRPVTSRRIGYKRNELPMARGDLAGIVLVSDVQLSDGSTLQSQLAALAAAALASGNVTSGGPLPSIDTTKSGDTHVGDDGTWYKRVEAGGILLGGAVVTLGGARPRLAWTLWPSQPARDALATATAAYSASRDALDQVAGLADDGLLSPGEKFATLVPEQMQLEAKWSVLAAQAAAFGVSASLAGAARASWNALLAGLLPAGNDVTVETPVNRSTFNGARDAYAGALYDLDRAIKAAGAQTADYAKVSGTPTQLGQINSGEGNKLGGIQSGADVTGSNTASGIVGQGVLATQNEATFSYPRFNTNTYVGSSGPGVGSPAGGSGGTTGGGTRPSRGFQP